MVGFIFRVVWDGELTACWRTDGDVGGAARRLRGFGEIPYCNSGAWPCCECLDGLGLRLWEHSWGETELVYLVTGRWRQFADPC